MSAVSYRSIEVPVEGGNLHVGVWGEQGPVIFCSHGITANHISFAGLAEQLGSQCQIIAPDHRGRGNSRDISGPWGMDRHADDIVAVLDHLDIPAVDLLIGHSMGGFIGVVTKARYPQRIKQLMLVDGGLPLMDSVPASVSSEDLIESVIGPAMRRLDLTFESVDDYLAFWTKHPAFNAPFDEATKRYFEYDLCGEAPALKPGVNKAAIICDTESQLIDDLVARSAAAIDEPITFVWAPRGIMNDAPLYTEERLEELQQRYPNIHRCDADDVNHYTVVVSPSGAVQLAEKVRRQLAA